MENNAQHHYYDEQSVENAGFKRRDSRRMFSDVLLGYDTQIGSWTSAFDPEMALSAAPGDK